MTTAKVMHGLLGRRIGLSSLSNPSIPPHHQPSQRGAHQSPFPQQSTGTRALEVSKLLNYGEQESVNNKRELTYKLPARKQSRWVD